MQICGDYQNALCYMVTLGICKFFLFALLTEKLLSLVAAIIITAMCMDDTHRALNTHSWFGTLLSWNPISVSHYFLYIVLLSVDGQQSKFRLNSH